MQASSTVDVATQISRPQFFARSIEGVWLAAAFLVPLLMVHDEAMLGFIQIPKVFVLRSLAVAVVFLATLEWALTTNVSAQTPLDLRGLAGRFWINVRSHAARLIVYAAGVVLLATCISLLFSPVKSIGISGINPGWDSYSLFSLVANLLFFAIVASRLRSQKQVERLIWVLTATSILIGLYGIGQHWGVDPLATDAAPASRISMTFGNPIFGASYLIMTIPLTFALFLSYRNRMDSLLHVWIGAALITIQLTAVTFTFGRGAWSGFVVGVIAFALAFGFVFGWRRLGRPAAIFAASLLFVALMNVIPVVGAAEDNVTFGERVESFAPVVAGGFNNRWVLWNTALDVYASIPWVDTEAFPEIPDLSFHWLRRFVGYGPGMFGYAYPLAGDTIYNSELATHGHNFLIHNLLEIGLFGAAAYIFLFVAVGIMLYRLLRKARQGVYPEWLSYLIVAMLSVGIARAVEQMPGKAQVADLHLMWILVALVVAMVAMCARVEQDRSSATSIEGEPATRRRSRRAHRGQVSGSVAGVSVPRVVLSSAVVLLGVVFWWQAILSPVQSSVLAANAENALASGETQRGIDLYLRAMDITPSDSIAPLNLSLVYFQMGMHVERPLEERVEFLEKAYKEAKRVRERNPMDHRSWARSAEYQRQLAVLTRFDPSEAIYDTTVMANLMPGFWQSRLALAIAFVDSKQYESALEAVQDSKDARILESPGAHLAYQFQALALEGLGRIDEARAAAHCSLSYRSTSDMMDLLNRFGDDVRIGDQLRITEDGLLTCPEQARSG